jgi:hypothetical protein
MHYYKLYLITHMNLNCRVTNISVETVSILDILLHGRIRYLAMNQYDEAQFVYSFLSLWFYSPSDLGRFFSFLILYTVGRTPWTGDQPVARPLPTHRTTQKQNKRTQTFMSQVGFEPTIPVFERAKTVHAVDRAATAIG